jgi:hypothetical protein
MAELAYYHAYEIARKARDLPRKELEELVFELAYNLECARAKSDALSDIVWPMAIESSWVNEGRDDG